MKGRVVLRCAYGMSLQVVVKPPLDLLPPYADFTANTGVTRPRATPFISRWTANRDDMHIAPLLMHTPRLQFACRRARTGGAVG